MLLFSKTDANGNLQWSKSFHHSDGSSHDLGSGSMCEDYEGNLVVAGLDYKSNGWVAKFSAAGVLLKEKIFSGIGTDTLAGIAATSDLGVVAAGKSTSFGDGGTDAWIIKLNSDLEAGDGCMGDDPGSVVSDAEFVEGTAMSHEIAIDGFATQDWNADTQDPGFYPYYLCIPENDQDNDGILDHEDNAPETYNPDQIDSDNDGIGNIVDCDLNNDGAVNMQDFNLFRFTWGSTGPDSDFNSDGVVNMHDFNILRFQWGTSYPWM